jgi:hypothetical protein
MADFNPFDTRTRTPEEERAYQARLAEESARADRERDRRRRSRVEQQASKKQRTFRSFEGAPIWPKHVPVSLGSTTGVGGYQTALAHGIVRDVAAEQEAAARRAAEQEAARRAAEQEAAARRAAEQEAAARRAAEQEAAARRAAEQEAAARRTAEQEAIRAAEADQGTPRRAPSAVGLGAPTFARERGEAMAGLEEGGADPRVYADDPSLGADTPMGLRGLPWEDTPGGYAEWRRLRDEAYPRGRS